MKMIDFTDCKRLVNSYEGADLKNKIEYLGDVYMLKFGQKLVPDSWLPHLRACGHPGTGDASRDL